MYALINDLEQRGLLDSTLVLMMGEFGRSPVMTQTAGRGHWTHVMSMLVAGGGLPCGQVIGSTDDKGYAIAHDRVTPQDLAATTFRHLGIDLERLLDQPPRTADPDHSGRRASDSGVELTFWKDEVRRMKAE